MRSMSGNKFFSISLLFVTPSSFHGARVRHKVHTFFFLELVVRILKVFFSLTQRSSTGL